MAFDVDKYTATSVSVNWDDLDWERSYDGMKAYRQSKIALGLFALELDRRSREAGWGISSNTQLTTGSNSSPTVIRWPGMRSTR